MGFVDQIFRLFLTFFPFDAFNNGDFLELSSLYLVGENYNGWVTIW